MPVEVTGFCVCVRNGMNINMSTLMFKNKLKIKKYHYTSKDVPGQEVY